MNILSTIISNVLTALYQPFWFSVILSVFFMFVHKTYSSIKEAVKEWIFWLKSDSSFRRTFLLVFYAVMILFRTLMNRNMKKTTLLIMAAGIGSRFGGGIKQLEPVGLHNEIRS